MFRTCLLEFSSEAWILRQNLTPKVLFLTPPSYGGVHRILLFYENKIFQICCDVTKFWIWGCHGKQTVSYCLNLCLVWKYLELLYLLVYKYKISQICCGIWHLLCWGDQNFEWFIYLKYSFVNVFTGNQPGMDCV